MKKIILVADDSPTIRKFVSFSLAAQGFKIITASDGMDALEKLPKENIDLIITDLNMPNLDGFEFVKSVRNSTEYKDIPIIILSSLDADSDLERGMQVGANAYLIKPFNPQRILYEVSKFLN